MIKTRLLRVFLWTIVLWPLSQPGWAKNGTTQAQGAVNSIFDRRLGASRVSRRQWQEFVQTLDGQKHGGWFRREYRRHGRRWEIWASHDGRKITMRKTLYMPKTPYSFFNDQADFRLNGRIMAFDRRGFNIRDLPFIDHGRVVSGLSSRAVFGRLARMARQFARIVK